MLTRRTLIASALASGVGAAVAPAAAQDWRARYPELVFAVVPGENSAGVMDRWGPLLRHLEREVGTGITLRIVQDFAAVIEGQRAGQIHIAWHGPSSYARARMIGVQIEPFAMDVNADGSTGYYSAFYVRASSPFQRIEDLRGRRLGLPAIQVCVFHRRTRICRADLRAGAPDSRLTDAALAGDLGGDGDPDPSSAGTAGDAARWGGSRAVVGKAATPLGPTGPAVIGPAARQARVRRGE
jgi:hypothetical protein